MTVTVAVLHSVARIREAVRNRLGNAVGIELLCVVGQAGSRWRTNVGMEPDVLVVDPPARDQLAQLGPGQAGVLVGPASALPRVSKQVAALEPPEAWTPDDLAAWTDRLVERVLQLGSGHRTSLRAPRRGLPRAGQGGRPRLVAIGASTGGVEALHVVLSALPGDVPPVLVVQHIPQEFSGPLAARLDEDCRVKVVLAEDGLTLERGTVYLAPGDHHLVVGRSRHELVARLNQGPKRAFHRPSVDALFESVHAAVGRPVVAVLMTGLGKDGAAGLARLRDAGAWTIAQDEATSSVWGMPGAAVALGAACEVLPLGHIAAAVVSRCTVGAAPDG